MASLSVQIDRSRLERLLRGGVTVTLPAAVFRIHGPGAIECLQGILSNDLVGPGSDRLVYAALLTPKGMILVDFWVAVRSDEAYLIASPEGRQPALEVFRRSLPPRLATIEDLSDAWSVQWLYGEMADTALVEAKLAPAPPAGQTSSIAVLGSDILLASGTAHTPFVAFVAGPTATLDHVANLVSDHGMTGGEIEDYHAARILAGWPALGVEIGEKTLPQEARFETIDGVSYTKGCFIGQETVARVHFRGRTQKELHGVDWIDLQPLNGTSIANSDRTLGQVHSILTLPDRRIGLGMIRREAKMGDTVLAGGREAKIVPLPFDLPDQAA